MGRGVSWGVALLAVALCGAAARGEGDGGNAAAEARLAAEESRMAAKALADENAKLKAAVDRLNGEVRFLTLSLAEATAELDVLRKADEASAWATPEAAVRPAGWDAMASCSVIGVNPALNLVVLDAGSEAGVKPGMIFSVLRGQAVIARVRAVDVRGRIAGTVMDFVEKGSYPAKGDRAVLGRESGK
jgi:hypothetical protein